jgi:hypothetical protein
VEGKTAFPQTPTNQGIVEIKNNAVIEYAYDAVTLGRFYDWGYDIKTCQHQILQPKTQIYPISKNAPLKPPIPTDKFQALRSIRISRCGTCTV